MTSRRPQNTSQRLRNFRRRAANLAEIAVELGSYLSGHAATPEWLDEVVQKWCGNAASLNVYVKVWKGDLHSIRQIGAVIDQISCLIRDGQETITSELEEELSRNLNTYAAMILGLAALAHNHW